MRTEKFETRLYLFSKFGNYDIELKKYIFDNLYYFHSHDLGMERDFNSI